MNKLTLKWDAELEHDIRKMVPMDGGRALAMLDWSYKRLTCFCLETREVRWTHRLRKGSFCHLSLAAFGFWIFVQREVGSKEDFLLFHSETGECRELSGLSGCCFLRFCTENHAVFCLDENGAATIDLETGDLNIYDGIDHQFSIVSGNESRFLGWREIADNEEIFIGALDHGSGEPSMREAISLEPGRWVWSQRLLLWTEDPPDRLFRAYSWDGVQLAEGSIEECGDGPGKISSGTVCSLGDRAIIRVNCVVESGLRLHAFDCESAEFLWSYHLSKGVSIEGSAGSDCPIQLLRGVVERLDPEDAYWRGFPGVRQLDLLTGEVSDLISEPIASEACTVESGLFFTRLEKGRKSLSYGEFTREDEEETSAKEDRKDEALVVRSTEEKESREGSVGVIPFQFFDSALMLMVEGKEEPEADYESLGGVFLELNVFLMDRGCDLSAFVFCPEEEIGEEDMETMEYSEEEKEYTRRISGNDYHPASVVAAALAKALKVCREMDEALFGEFKGEVVADLEDLIHLLGEMDDPKVPVQLCLIS